MLAKPINGQVSIEKWQQESKDHIDVLHKGNKGWITLSNIKNGQYKQWHYKYSDILNFIEKIDCFISQNTFYSTFRRIEYIKELTAIFIDLDCYNTDYRKESVIYFLESELYNHEIPVPTMIIDSGRGLYLIWKIKNVPGQALPLYQAIQKNFYEKLKAFGADPKAIDCTRILRIAGTTNSKSNTQVKILEMNDIEYDIHYLRDEFLPDIEPKTSLHNKKGRPKKALHLFNQYTLYYSRIQDLIKVCELRGWYLEGKREVILFLYRYWSCCFIGDKEEALKQVLELNVQFIEPLSEREVVKSTRSAEKVYQQKDKQYNYRNQTLTEILAITEEEQKSLKTIISKKEANEREKISKKAKRRNESGLTKREQSKQNTHIEVQGLKLQGLTQKQVAMHLGKHINTIKQHWKD